MLINTEAMATIAVHDMDKARKFYERTLELEPEDKPDDMAITYKAGGSRLLVYKSDFAGGYEATVATWPMSQGIGNIVSTLKEKGVTFEHYPDMPGTLEGDIHVMGEMKNAWFKDPEGNIHCLVQHPKNS